MSSETYDPNLTPAMKAPPGITSNLIDPPSQEYVAIIVMVILLTLTTPMILIRLYTRYFIDRHLWWDDYATVIAWVGLFGLAGIIFEMLKFGGGVDLWNVSVAHSARFKKLFEDLEIVARISMFFTKLSILLLFFRLFHPHKTQKTKRYYIIWLVIWFNLLYCLALVFLVLLQCVGTSKPESQCVNQYLVLVTASLINVLSDIMIFVIPVVNVWNLRMPKERKLQLLVVFAVGIIAIITSLARLGWQIQRANNPNMTIILINVTLLTVGEQTAGIIVGCMPVLPAFFHSIFDQRPATQLSNPGSKKSIRGLGSSAVTYQSARPIKGGFDDPSLGNKEHKELDDLEHGHSTFSISLEGTTTTIEAGCWEPSALEEMIQSLNERPQTNALVSTSVQVESHPRVMEKDHDKPQAVYIRH